MNPAPQLSGLRTDLAVSAGAAWAAADAMQAKAMSDAAQAGRYEEEATTDTAEVEEDEAMVFSVEWILGLYLEPTLEPRSL